MADGTQRAPDSSNHDDARMIAAVARGNHDALSELYEKYSGPMLAFAMRMLRSRVEAEDLLHDVMLEVWQRAGAYDPSRGSVRAWIAVRVRSRALDRLKAPRVRRAVQLEERHAEALTVTLDIVDLRELRALLPKLTRPLRDVVRLCYFHGLTVHAAAERLGCAVGTVKSRLDRARSALRAQLAAAPA